ncbi:hypothetical protein FDECE_16794 [Fusarium decemcellulare]|nr:hypothetical protein FDECE_16794 [Fusarium decemcellulare]
MPGCLEGHHAVATQILEGIDHNALIQELENLADDAVGASSQSHIFYSSTNRTPIVTMKNGKFSAVAAMAIKNGKILKIGSLDEVKEAATTVNDTTDLRNTCIVPGFVEPHLHIITSAMLEKFLLNCDPLNSATGGTFEGTIAYIQKAAQKVNNGSWLLGYGYDPSRLEPHDGSFRDLTTAVFDKYNLNDHPILIINASGHIAYANALAIKEAGVENPHEGVLIESEFQPVIEKALPSQLIKVPEILWGLCQVVTRWSRKGFTTVFDAGVGLTVPRFDAIILSCLAKIAPLRIAGAAANMTPDKAAEVVGDGPMPPDGATRLKIKTIKLWMDGSTQGFTGALEQQYKNDMLPGYFGPPPYYGWARWEVHDTCKVKPLTHDNIYTEMQKWASRGYQLMVHVNGDCASEVVLDAFEKLHTPNPKVRHRLEHFTVTHPEQVQRAAKLNLYVSHTIQHVKYWGHTFDHYIIGADRAQRIHPVRDDVDSGLVYSLHSDSPVSDADGLSYVRTAATRLMYEKPEAVLGPDQRVTVEQALAGITVNPAHQILLDGKIGTLEEGKDADFVILKQDITSQSIDARDISSDWVLETWFKGRKRSQNAL